MNRLQSTKSDCPQTKLFWFRWPGWIRIFTDNSFESLLHTRALSPLWSLTLRLHLHFGTWWLCEEETQALIHSSSSARLSSSFPCSVFPPFLLHSTPPCPWEVVMEKKPYICIPCCQVRQPICPGLCFKPATALHTDSHLQAVGVEVVGEDGWHFKPGPHSKKKPCTY